MLHGRVPPVWSIAVITLLTVSALAQSVISTHSGVVHYFEGEVSLSGQPLQSHLGTFPVVPQGGELRTAKGRAEVLLTPNVFIRIGENSAIRLLANTLADTRVELLSGAAIVDSDEPTSGTSVTLIYKNWSMRFPEQGTYRIDSDPPRLWVIQGKADVSAGDHAAALAVGQGMCLPFASVLVADRFFTQPDDMLSMWADGRRQSISADNAIAANIQDPASLDASNSGVDGFTNYPLLGMTSLGPGVSTYSSLGIYEPGFNSIYLPGYTVLPIFLGMGFGGPRVPVRQPPDRFPSGHLPPVGLPPGRIPPVGLPPVRLPSHVAIVPYSFPRYPMPSRIPMHPISAPPTAAHPVSPIHSAPPVGIHGGVHR